VRETLYLIPKSEMLATDTDTYPEYKYCPLAYANRYPKSEKIQVVALIASKPELSGANKLSWKVVDRSGKSNFRSI
jgi:hypothetical protein